MLVLNPPVLASHCAVLSIHMLAIIIFASHVPCSLSFPVPLNDEEKKTKTSSLRDTGRLIGAALMAGLSNGACCVNLASAPDATLGRI